MTEEKECCPKFDPQPWDGVEHEWKEKMFLMGSIPQLFHLPLPGFLNKTITRLWNQAQEYGIATDSKDFLLLAYDPSPWKSDLFLAVTKTHPEADNLTRITGKFVSKVFDGPYQAVPRYIKELDEYLGKSNRKAKKYYFYYTTCPKCAKKYAHNYIVAFAEV